MLAVFVTDDVAMECSKCVSDKGGRINADHSFRPGSSAYPASGTFLRSSIRVHRLDTQTQPLSNGYSPRGYERNQKTEGE